MSTKKYELLVSIYADQIAKIKRLQAIADADEKAAHDAGKNIEDEYDEFIAQRQAWQAYESSSYEVNKAAEMLFYDIDAEYADVPFAASRQAGIDAFYKLAFADDERLIVQRA